jgi:aerobic carbon-monoxide dehydrogenase medium subunit
MHAFDYRRPGTVNEADLALKAAPGAKLLAGGQTLIPTLKLRLANPETIIDLSGIASLRGIARKDGGLAIGAMTTHAAVAESRDVAAAIPGLAKLADDIGDPQVRHRGTIGGSIANNDPAADYPAAVLALNATLNTTKRAIAADQFFDGLFSTTLAENEILTEIVFPQPQSFAYAKFDQPASRFALVGVAVARTAGGVRVAVTGAGQGGVFRWTEAEQALTANFAPAALSNLKVDPSNLMSDVHADAAYRAHLVGVMAKRAVAG